MGKHLKVNLPPKWQDISQENPDGPPTFVRSEDDAAGVLQISIQSLYESGPEPNPSYADLIRLSEHIASVQDAEVLQKYSGDCELGKFGCVIAKSSDVPNIQIWTLSNNKDFVLATYLCTEDPCDEEMNQAEAIVKTVTLQT